LIIADRLKALREQKNMSQGDVENRTGPRRCYISRVENGHTAPAIETLEKMARALEVPIYALFYDGEKPPASLPKLKTTTAGWGSSGRDARTLGKFRRLFGRIDKADINLLPLHDPENGSKTKVHGRSKTIALRRFFTLSIVDFSPKFRGRILKFDAEFVPSRRIKISTPNHAP
jgi:transcriptional regulator with XRE-family HTH domain